MTMKFTLRCHIILMLALVPIMSFAQEVTVVDTSSPGDALVEPTMVMTPATVKPDCHTYTGCGLIVVKKVYHKPKRHPVCHQACCVTRGCY